MITRRNFVVLAGIGAMGLLNTAGCAAPAEEPPRDVSGEQEPLEEPSPIPQKEPVASSEPFSGEIIPGMLCVAEYATNTLAVVDARAGEVAGRIPVGRNPASVLAVGGEGEQQVSDLYVLDRSSGKRVQEVPVGQSVAGVAQASDGSAVWAIARDDGELVAFDADWNETGRLSLGVGIDTLVLAPDEKTLLVGNSIGGQVHVVDAPSLALLNTIEGLASPKGIAVIA